MKRLPILALALLLAPTSARADDPPRSAAPARKGVLGEDGKYRYRGLTVDVAVLARRADREATLASLRRQIDMVVDAQVRPEVAEFFTTIKAALGPVPPNAGPGISHGRSVVIVAQPIEPNRVVLLHELLHSYHSVRMKPEARAQVTRFYEEARRRYKFPPSEYFLTNEREFFAVTASIYLHGAIPRPPGTRQVIEQTQPEYARFLGELFDPSPPTNGTKPTATPPPTAPAPPAVTPR